MKYNRYLWQVILVLILAAILISCSNSKVITGEIRAVNGDTVVVRQYRFKVLENVPKINDKCTFTPTRDSSKVNCIKIKP